MKITKKEWYELIYIAGSGIVLLFLFNIIFPTVINGFIPANVLTSRNINFSFLTSTINYHITFPPFAGRVATTTLIKIIHLLFHTDLAISFILVEFGLLFACVILVYILARNLRLSHKHALWSVGLFFGSYTILFAFFSSIYTYDDPLQYLFFFLTLFALFSKRWWLVFLFLCGAVITRETTVLLFPGLLFFLFDNRLGMGKLSKVSTWVKVLLLFTIPTIIGVGGMISILFYKGLWSKRLAYVASTRFSFLSFNITNNAFALETLVLILFVVVVPLVVILYEGRGDTDLRHQRLLRASLITALINTPVVLFTARVREARLLALPFVFTWPLLGMYLPAILHRIRRTFVYMLKYWYWSIPVVIFLFGVGYIFWYRTFYPTDSAGFEWGYRIYFFVASIVATLYFANFFLPPKLYDRTHS